MKPALKVLQADRVEDKPLHEKTMLEIIGREQDRSNLKPPHFAVATDRPEEPSAFKQRRIELYKAKRQRKQKVVAPDKPTFKEMLIKFFKGNNG